MIIARKHTVLSNKVTRDLNIIQISDLHYSDFTSSEKLDKIIKKISNYQPDYIIFCGDIFVGICKSYNRLIAFFNLLNKISPVYLTYGNHDLMSLFNTELFRLKWKKKVYNAVLDEIKNMGNIFVLENESVYLDDYNITISGIYMDFEHYEEKKRIPMILLLK